MRGQPNAEKSLLTAYLPSFHSVDLVEVLLDNSCHISAAWQMRGNQTELNASSTSSLSAATIVVFSQGRRKDLGIPDIV